MRAVAEIAWLASLALWGTPPAASPTVHRLSSPNGRIAVAVRAAPDLTYDLSFDGKPLLAGATLALDVDHVRLGAAARITATLKANLAWKAATRM